LRNLALGARWNLRELGLDKCMSKEAEYRRHAANTLELAQRAKSPAHKARLLVMADDWLDLADRAHKVARRQADKLDQEPGEPGGAADHRGKGEVKPGR